MNLAASPLSVDHLLIADLHQGFAAAPTAGTRGAGESHFVEASGPLPHELPHPAVGDPGTETDDHGPLGAAFVSGPTTSTSFAPANPLLFLGLAR